MTTRVSKVSPACRDAEAVFCLLNRCDRVVEEEFRTVFTGVFRHGDGELPGAYDCPGGGIEGRGNFIAEGGFHFKGFLFGEDAEPLHAVGDAPVIELLDGFVFLRGKCQHKGTNPLKGD